MVSVVHASITDIVLLAAGITNTHTIDIPLAPDNSIDTIVSTGTGFFARASRQLCSRIARTSAANQHNDRGYSHQRPQQPPITHPHRHQHHRNVGPT